MTSPPKQFTVLHGKFAAYLSWSQPFLYALLRGLEPHCRNVIVCHRTENLDRFPVDNIVRLQPRDLIRPSRALLASIFLSRHWQPDVLHAHFGWSGIRMLLLKRFLRAPLVTTFGGKDAGTQMHMPHYDRLYEILLHATDQIVCVSNDLKDQLVKHGVDADRIEVIRRGTNLEQFRFVDRSGNSPDRPIQLLMVGRLVEKKGHRYAFEAIARLLKKGHKLSLAVAGEGDDYHLIRRLRNELGLQKHVRFVGSTNHEGVRRLMGDADVFLHCSVTGANGDCEGIPNVIVEAASTGLPVIGTRHGGIVETIQHGKTGFLVEERDIDGLSDAIERLVQSRETRLACGEAGSTFMREHFDLQRQVEGYMHIYERLAEEYHRGEFRTPGNPIPDDFSRLVTNTLLPDTGVQDFSLAELIEWLRGPGRMEDEIKLANALDARPGMFERCYNLKEYVPQTIKFPVKAALGHSIAVVINRLNAGPYRKAITRLQETDKSVLDFFRSGGRLDQLPGNANPNEVFERLPELCDPEECVPGTDQQTHGTEAGYVAQQSVDHQTTAERVKQNH